MIEQPNSRNGHLSPLCITRRPATQNRATSSPPIGDPLPSHNPRNRRSSSRLQLRVALSPLTMSTCDSNTTPEHLQTFGFRSTTCRRCNVGYEEIGALLIQCGKCKQVYYCSMRCFNEDLVDHQRFCTTGELYSEPKRRPPLEAFAKAAVEEEIPELSPVKKEEAASEEESESTLEEIVQEEEEVVNEDEEEVVEEEIVEEEQAEGEEPVEKEDRLGDDDLRSVDTGMGTEEIILIDVGDDDASTGVYGRDDNPEDEPGHRYRIRLGTGVVPEPDIFEPEIVHLRECGLSPKREYAWAKPDWGQLRPTDLGALVKAAGDLAKPVTAASTLIESGEITWAKPDWLIRSPLRESPKSKVVKMGGTLSKPVTMIAEYVEKGEVPGWQKPDWVEKSPLSKPAAKVDSVAGTEVSIETEATGGEVERLMQVPML